MSYREAWDRNRKNNFLVGFFIIPIGLMALAVLALAIGWPVLIGMAIHRGGPIGQLWVMVEVLWFSLLSGYFFSRMP